MASYTKKVPRVCAACGEDKPYQNQPDPCLGRLPGVTNACCGHGFRNQCYVVEETETRIIARTGDEALMRLIKLGGAPMPFYRSWTKDRRKSVGYEVARERGKMSDQEHEELTISDILEIREEGKLQADMDTFGGEPRQYVLILHELYPNGTTSGGLIEDPLIAARIGEVTGLGPPTDPNGWGIWVINQKETNDG